MGRVSFVMVEAVDTLKDSDGQEIWMFDCSDDRQKVYYEVPMRPPELFKAGVKSQVGKQNLFGS